MSCTEWQGVCPRIRLWQGWKSLCTGQGEISVGGHIVGKRVIYSQFSVVSGNGFMVYLIGLAGPVHLTWSQSQLSINPIQSRCLIAKVMIGCKWLQSKAPVKLGQNE